MFMNVKDSLGRARRIHLLFDKFPIALHDGESFHATNTAQFIIDNDGDTEVVDAVTRLILTREPQSVGMGFLIKLL